MKFNNDDNSEWGHLGIRDLHQYAFQKIYCDLKEQGKETSPRDQKVLEIENYEYELYPYVRFTNFEDRNFNLNYVKKEFLWYLKGDRFDTSITEHASMWKHLIAKDGGINSNYGQYIFGEMNQFDNVVKVLKEDKDSRRASISILSAEHLLSEGESDYPCTYSMNFRIRNNFLNMSVNMRSQDAIFGMSNDAPTFSMIHEMMYITLKEKYPELKYGMYHHKVDSFHVYEKHFNMLNLIELNETKYKMVYCPKISSVNEVNYLRKLHEPAELLSFPNKTISDLKPPEDYKFVKWLITAE